MKNLRMFEVRYIGPSNTRGAYAKILDLRHGKSITFSISMSELFFVVEARKILEDKGIHIAYQSQDESRYGKTKFYLFSEDFSTQIRKDKDKE